MTRHDISAEEWEIVQYYRRRAKRIAHAKKLRRNKGRVPRNPYGKQGKPRSA
jgi:hypothetical protein